jgi:hypothetical protein
VPTSGMLWERDRYFLPIAPLRARTDSSQALAVTRVKENPEALYKFRLRAIVKSRVHFF